MIRGMHSWNVTFSEAARQARAGAGDGKGSGINIFPRRSISLVRRNGCLPAPCGRESPSGQKQIKAHTLQIGDLPQLARRREFSAALIEKSLSRLLPISRFLALKRNRTLCTPWPATSGSPHWPAVGRAGRGGSVGGRLRALASLTPPHASWLRCTQWTVSDDWFIRPIYLLESVIMLVVKN